MRLFSDFSERAITRVIHPLTRGLAISKRRYEELCGLCTADIEHWRQQQLDYTEYLLQLEALSDSQPDLFVFDIEHGKVTAREKAIPNLDTQLLLQARLPAYLEFFERVVRTLGPELKISFGLLLGDLATGNAQVPLLSFQKISSDNLLLVPDIESLTLRFYDSPDLVDELDYAAKRAAAVFVGSTTGVDPATGGSAMITREVVDHAPTQRIRAAKRFQGRADITFKLPGVVQCDSTDTVNYLRTFEFTHGGSVSWKSQFAYRFIISVDGNGATCSRMALALRSQSVLLKYASPYVLFYTRALAPFVHYLPVADDDDVIEYVAALRRAAPNEPLPFSEIQHNANRFYRRFLSRTAQHCYAAVLLNELQGLFHGQRIDAIRQRIETLDGTLDIMVHVGFQGDRWCWPSKKTGSPGNGETIEAFSIRHDLRDASERDLEYQCLLQDGTIGAWLPSGTLCGERSQCKSLAGFRIRVSGEFAARCTLRYRASFVGAPETPWVDAGNWCASPDRLPLESFELDLAPRGVHLAMHRLRTAWT